MGMSCNISERRKKYELQKKENPKAHIPEPWPAVCISILWILNSFQTNGIFHKATYNKVRMVHCMCHRVGTTFS